jgi:glycosyltransferase involved in cell wall biosynthesis
MMDRQQQARIVMATTMYLNRMLSLRDASRLTELQEHTFLEAVGMAKTIGLDAEIFSLNEAIEEAIPSFKLSVLVPVYNERQTILEILDRVQEVQLPIEIIIVDDHSTDGTRNLLREQVEGAWENVAVFYHDRNRGKGAAIRTAITHATGTIGLIQDADLELDPREYHQLVAPIVAGRADVVYGSRFIGGRMHCVYPFWQRFGNAVLTSFSNVVNNLSLTDMETCYKVMRLDLMRSLQLRSDRFEIEPEITAKIARAKVRIYEVPISYTPRDHSNGKKIGVKDGIKALYSILYYRLKD